MLGRLGPLGHAGSDAAQLRNAGLMASALGAHARVRPPRGTAERSGPGGVELPLLAFRPAVFPSAFLEVTGKFRLETLMICAKAAHELELGRGAPKPGKGRQRPRPANFGRRHAHLNLVSERGLILLKRMPHSEL